MKTFLVLFSVMFALGAYAYGNQTSAPVRSHSTTGTCYNLPDCSGSILGTSMDSNDCESQGGESMADNFGYCTNF